MPDTPEPSLLQRLARGGPRPVWMRYLLLIAAASGLVRLALDAEWMRTSAVLYVLVPFLIGVAIYLFTPQPVGSGFGTRLWSHMRASLIVMLSTSLLLFEGFLCVMMFMPIYLFFSAVVIAFTPDRMVGEDEAARRARVRDTFRLTALPLLVVVLSLDGVRGFGPDRAQVVSRSAVLDMSPADVRAAIIDHEYPKKGRSRWLSLFPRPVHVEAPSMDVGARHVAHMEYRRWGVPWLNVHQGTNVMEITRSDPLLMQARFVHDDSYLSHYMTFQRWQMELEPLGDGRTRATIAVAYQRDLAPSWYFGPPMRAAVGDGLDYVLNTVLAGGAHGA